MKKVPLLNRRVFLTFSLILIIIITNMGAFPRAKASDIVAIPNTQVINGVAPINKSPFITSEQSSIRLINTGANWTTIATNIDISNLITNNFTIEFWMYAENLTAVGAGNLAFGTSDAKNATLTDWTNSSSGWFAINAGNGQTALRNGWNKVSLNMAYSSKNGAPFNLLKINLIYCNNNFAQVLYIHDIKITSKPFQTTFFQISQHINYTPVLQTQVKVIENNVTGNGLVSVNEAPAGDSDQYCVKVPCISGAWQQNLSKDIDLNGFDRTYITLEMWVFVDNPVYTNNTKYSAVNFRLSDSLQSSYELGTNMHYEKWLTSELSNFTLGEWNKISIKYYLSDGTGSNVNSTNVFNFSVYQFAFNTFYIHDVKLINSIDNQNVFSVLQKQTNINFNNYILSKFNSNKYLSNISSNLLVGTFKSGLALGDATVVIKDKSGNTILGNSSLVTTGATVEATAYGETNSYKIVIFGDVDGNGLLGLNDLTLIRDSILEKTPLTGDYKLAGDIYGEGSITLNSLVGLMAYNCESESIVQNREIKPSTLFWESESKEIELGNDVNGKVRSYREGGLIKAPITDSFSDGVYKSNLNTVISTIKNIDLQAGYYKFLVNVRADNNSSSNLNIELRVFDNINTDIIGFLGIQADSFSSTVEFVQQEVSFFVKERTNINLQVFSYNTANIEIKDFSIIKITTAQYNQFNVSEYLKSSDEDSIQLDLNTLYYFDLKEYVKQFNDTRYGYDVINLICTLQGLVNRNNNLLYVKLTGATGSMTVDSVDDFWLSELTKSGAYLGNKNIKVINKPATLLRLFRGFYNGLVSWDEKVPATVNTASTACGVENLLPVRYDSKQGSLYNILTQEYNLNVQIDLHNRFTGKDLIWETNEFSTGSAKNDAYIWAYKKYMDKGLTSKRDIAYHTDAMSWDTSNTATTYTYYSYQKNLPYEFLYLGNKDYLISQKAFFYDLFPYTAESGIVPNDDINQNPGTDYNTLVRIFIKQKSLASGELFYIHGYNNYFLKYSSHVNNVPNYKLSLVGDVTNEGVLGNMASYYYASILANGLSYNNICNQSIFVKTNRVNYSELTSKPPLDYKTRVAQNKYYFSFYMGDYDSTSWTYSLLPTFFNDPNRGKIPLSWPISPTCERIIPNIHKYIYENRTGNDYFVGANNGAGFSGLSVMDSRFLSPYKTYLDLFLEHTAREFNRMSLDIMGMLIITNGDNNIEGVMNKFVRTPINNGGFKGVFSTYWSAFNGGLDLNYVYNGVPVLGAEFDTKGAGMVEPSQANFKSYLLEFLKNGKVPSKSDFHYIRTVLASPTKIYNAIKELQDEGYAIEVLDPYTYQEMVKKSIS